MKENNLNNKITSNNKFNFPTTWTKKKMASLFLMGLMSVNRVEAGEAFRNCLADNSNNLSYAYNPLLEYSFDNNSAINSGKMLKFCCDSFQCISSPPPCSAGAWEFGCAKIGQTIDCDGWWSPCGGIVGNTPISNITIGSLCSRFDIKNTPSYISTITPVGINKGYAYWLCPPSSPCNDMWCHWDNGGWTCLYNDINNLNTICSNDGLGNYACSSYCIAHWIAPWPGPNNTNPFPQTSTVSSINPNSPPTSTSSLITSTILVPDYTPEHLTEKIAIPIGTIVGVATVSGVTYYLIRQKKKKQLLLIAGNRETNNPNEFENKEIIKLVTIQPRSEEGAHEIFNDDEKDAEAHEVAASSSQSQLRTEEENRRLKEEMTILKQRLEKAEEQNKKIEANIQIPPK